MNKKMTVVEMKKVVKAFGQKGFSKWNQKQLVEFLDGRRLMFPDTFDRFVEKALGEGFNVKVFDWSDIRIVIPQETADTVNASEASEPQASEQPSSADATVVEDADDDEWFEAEEQRINTKAPFDCDCCHPQTKTMTVSEPVASEPSADEVRPSAETQTKGETKMVEFVGNTNLQVQYKVRGELVIVGWSKKDFKMHVYSVKKGDRLTSYATMIKQFSKLQDGVHGDIALIVYALKRIAKKPAPIVLLERQAKKEATSSTTKENQRQAKSTKGTVDPVWLAEFRASNPDADGRTIKAAWDARQAN